MVLFGLSMNALWEPLEYLGEILVFVGVVGEVLTERKLILKEDEERRDVVEGFASWILVAGLAISLAALIGTNAYFNGTIAALNLQAEKAAERAAQNERDAAEARKEADSFQSQIVDATARTKEAEAKVASAEAASKDAVAKVATADARIAEAQKGAAQATATAEREKLEQDQLELLVSPRRLTLDQQEKIGKACAGMNRGLVQVGSYGMDSEGRALANQIAYAIFDRTFPINFDQGGPVTSGALDEGVLINGPETAERFMGCLADALVNIGQLKAVKVNGERHVGTSFSGGATMSGGVTMSGGSVTTEPGPSPAGSPVHIFVGVKPIELLLLKK
jgi:hypothetical protein